MSIAPVLFAALRAVPPAAAAVLLSACAAWPAGEAPRTSVAMSAPSSMGRPDWLQRLVGAMDAEAFQQRDGLRLRLSYQLSTDAPLVARTNARDATGG